jgi:hypothetical protein
VGSVASLAANVAVAEPTPTGRVGVDPDHPPPRPRPLGQTTHLMTQAAAHVQDLIPWPNRASIEHPPLDLLNQRALAAPSSQPKTASVSAD